MIMLNFSFIKSCEDLSTSTRREFYIAI